MSSSDPSSDSSSAWREPTAYLPLVGHVVNQLASRYPRSVDRHVLWTAGAWGLVVAVRQSVPLADAAFTSFALRAIRAHVLDAYRDDAELGDDEQLATELGLTTPQLESLREAFMPVQRPGSPIGVRAGVDHPQPAPRTAAHSVYAAAAAVL